MLDDGATTVSLAVLLADAALGLTRVAGPVADTRVASVATTELADPTPYVSPGQLFLTAGIALPPDPDGIDRYVAALAGAGVAALGFGVEPVHDRVPDPLVAACDRAGIPLIKLPPGTPFVAVGHAFTMAVARQRQQDLAQEAHDLAALVEATNSVDPLRAVVRQLARCTGAAVVLLDRQGRDLASGGRRLPASTRQLVRARAADATEGDGVPHDTGRLSVHVVPTIGRAGGGLVLVVAGNDAPTTSRRRTIATATWLMALLTSQQHALTAGADGVGALVRLMTGDQAAAMDPLLRSAVKAPGRHWVVVRGQAASRSARAPRHSPVDLATLRTAIGTPYLDVAGSRLTALIPCTQTAPPHPPADPATLHWILGYSNPVTVHDLVHGRAQADQALRTARANNRPAWVNDAAAATLGSLVPAAEGEAFARSLFAPLGDATTDTTRTLLTTLRTWLSCHGSQDRTASTLEIHRNTVRHRLTQVAGVLNLDLQDPDVRMTLWFALRQLPD